MTPNSKKNRMAYLLSQYPAISHTFFLKEILGLRQLGFEIETVSVNPPDRPASSLPPREQEEAERTYFLKQIPLWEAIFALLAVIFGHPRVAIRGFRAAMTLGGLDVTRKLYALFYTVEAFLVGDWMRKRNLHHLHTHFGGAVATVAMLTAQAWKVDYSMTIHGPEEFYEADYIYLPQKIAGAKFIFCISDFCRSQLMKYSDPIHWDKMHIVPLGVNTDEFKPVAREARQPLGIICVGRLVPAKGQHILLKAFSQVLSKGHSLHLTLVGNGPDRESLEREVARYDLAGKVTFCGALNHDETQAKLAEANIFALASFAEGIPVALMEAMAMGIPCVSTSIAGIPALIRNEIDGLLVPPSSVEGLASAIERLVLDDALRQKLGASGRAHVVENYNLAVNLNLLASTFKACLT
jgi:colanic acid/amylovoran biosynthesis glycosyltransferase